ncbi:translocation/assembly module TamB domain-containing protein [Fluviispira sanaruensis]|uniref:Translocation/assembly module TamB n=1 Tax=Fluviispira sanaruensis TaxID=2493639 RepID=A0A4P2VHN9_FLUSA|nr:hypothetical protein [Fluviispira sanaruensis]BBH51828.1 hypothetical protein JCM31447_02510 [Fluviispira sanaruensis]
MIKFFKRIILFIIATFVSMNVAVFFILNSQTVQHAIVEYINVNYFNKQNLDLSLGSLSLSFFTGTLNLNEVYIKEKANENNNSKENFIGLNQLSVSLNLTSSYVKRSFVIRKILLRGLNLNIKYDENGELILPKYLIPKEKEQTSEGPINIPELVRKMMSEVQFDLEIINIVVQLGEINKNNYQKISLSHAEFKKIKDKNNIPSFQTEILLGDSAFKFPVIDKLITLSYLRTHIILNEKGDFNIHELDLQSNLANLNANINGNIGKKVQNTKYKAQIEMLEIDGKEAFDLLQMESSGKVLLKGQVESGKNLYEDPTFKGEAKWKNLTLESFDIYSGKADVIYVSRKIVYDKADIKTPLEGRIHAKGEFQFYKNFYFENIANVENLNFSELLKGLKVEKTPVDFKLSSENLKVSGYILSSNKKKSFELFAKGEAKAQKLYVNTFLDQVGRKPIPDININLDLRASALGLSLTKTEGAVKNLKTFNLAKFVIDEGYIDFTPKSGVGVNFKMTGKNIDISIAEYFLKFPTAGIADFTGELKLDRKTNEIEFSSQSKVYKGEIFGVQFEEFNGKWGLNTKGVWIKNADILVGRSENFNKSTLNLNNFDFNFDDMHSNINAKVNGKLNNLIYAVQYWLPQSILDTDADIKNFEVKQKGLFFHLSTWDLLLKSKLENIKLLDSVIHENIIDFNCKSGLCTDSLISFLDIKTTEEIESGDEDNTSFAIFELYDLSFENAGMRGNIFKLPLGMFARIFEKKISGVLNSNIQFKGKWSNLEGFANVNAYKISLDKSELGDFNLQLNPYDKNKIKIDLNAFSNQLNAFYIMQQGLEGDTILNINLVNFNSFFLIDSETRAKNSLFSQINAAMRFEGIAPFTKDENKKWYQYWKGSGKINSASVQVGKAIFELAQPQNIVFDGDEIKLDVFNLGGKIGRIQFGKTNLNFTKKTIYSSLNLDFNLGNFDLLSDAFGPSEGDLSGQFSITGSLYDPLISGSLYIGAKTLFVKSLQPAFNNLNAELKFKGKKLEIQNFFSEKGDGNLSASGSIDFSPIFSENPKYPEVTIKIVSKKADFRLLIPIFQIADMNVDSELTLSGTDIPYLLTGEVNLKKLRLFKDINCESISSQLFALNNSQKVTSSHNPFLAMNVNIHALSSFTIQSQCIRGRFSTSPLINLNGTSSEPIITGTISTDSASLILLKSRFEVKKAEFTFIELQKYDPNVDIFMEARVASETISVSINGRLSKSRLELSASPSTLPNGDRITQPDIISMISTGQVPAQSSSANLLTASTSLFPFIGYGNFSENSLLNNTVSTVTGGIIDNVTVSPTTQNGQVSWRATASRTLSQRLNLGVSYEAGDIGTRSSAYATFILNDTVSIFGSYDNNALTQQAITTEWTTGLRFRFGSQ